MKIHVLFLSVLLLLVSFMCISSYAALDAFTVDQVVTLVNDPAGKPTANMKSIVVGDTVRFSGTIEGTELGDLTLAIDKSGSDTHWSDAGYKGIYSRLDVVKRDSATWQMTEEQAVTFTEAGLYRIFCWNYSTPSAFTYFIVLPKTPSAVTNVKVDGKECASGGDFMTLRNEVRTLTYTIGADANTSYVSVGKSNGVGGWSDITGWSGREFAVGSNRGCSVTLDIYEIAAAAGVGNGSLRITIYAGNSRGGVSGAYILWIRIGWKLSSGTFTNGTVNFYNANLTTEEYVSGRTLFQRKPFIIKVKASEGYYLEKVLIAKRYYTGKTEVSETQIVQYDEPTQGIYQSEPLCFHDADTDEYPKEIIDEIIVTPVFREQKMVDVRIANINRKYIDLDFWGLMVVSYTNVGTVYYGTTKDYGYTAKVEKDGEIIDLIEVTRKKVGTTTLYWKVYVDETHQIHEGKTDITVYKAPVTVTANNQTIVYGSSINTAHTSCGAIGVGEYHVLYSAKYKTSTTNVTDNGQIIPYDARFLNADHTEDVTDQYELTYVPGKLVITPKPLVPSVQANHKVYDGTTDGSGEILLTGVVSGDAVTASATSYAFDNKNVGTGKTVSAKGITLSGASAGNYTVSSAATGKADITAKTLDYKVNVDNKIYDGTTVGAGTITLTNVVYGDSVSANAESYTFADRNVGTDITVAAMGIVLSGNDAKNYTIVYSGSGYADITARTVTATMQADNKEYDGTTAATGHLLLSGVLPGDEVAAVAQSYNFAGKNVGNGRTVTAEGIALVGADSMNYIMEGLEKLIGVANILKKPVTVTAKDQTIPLGSDIAFGTDKITTTELANGDTVVEVTLSADFEKGTITPSVCRFEDSFGADMTSNYDISYADGIITVEHTKLRGDVNCDGEVRMNDLILLLSYLSTSAPLSEQGMINADVTEDGKVLMNDLVVLLTYLSGPPSLPCPSILPSPVT